MFNGKEFGQNIVDTVKVYVSGALAPLADNMKAEADARRAENEKLRAELEELRAAIKAVPVPEPVDLSEMKAAIAEHHAWVGESVKELIQRLNDLPTPVDGKDADPELVRSMVAEAVAELPPAKDGASVTVEDVAPLIDSAVHERMGALVPDIADLVAKAVAEIPKPQDGKSVDIEVVRGMVAVEVAESVKEAVSEIPAPRDGRDGLDVKDMFRADGGKLIAVMSDGTTRDLGVYVGKDGRDGIDGERGSDGADGAPGADGHDGVGFDELDVVLGDEGVDLVFTQGDRVKRFELALPYDRGVFTEGASYRKGNGVTWASQYWIAMKNGPEGKPGLSEDWRLAVRKGRDAKTPAKIGA